MRDNEVVLGINGRLQAVADDARAAARARHGTGVRVGQRYLLIRRIPDFLFARRVPQLCPQPRDLLRPTLRLRFSNVAFVAVGTITRWERISPRLDYRTGKAS